MQVQALRFLSIVLVAGLAGCAATSERLPLPPEPVAVEAREGAAIPVARSYSEVLVRAYVEEDGGRRELGGADCLLEVGEFGVRFQSPGRVLVPVPQAGAPVLGVACRAGAREGTARRALTRDWTDPYPFARPYAFGRPHGWWGEPYRRWRSGVWLGAEFADPFWGHGSSWRRRGASEGYPDVEVVLR